MTIVATRHVRTPIYPLDGVPDPDDEDEREMQAFVRRISRHSAKQDAGTWVEVDCGERRANCLTRFINTLDTPGHMTNLPTRHWHRVAAP